MQSPISQSDHTLVIGGGIVGSCCALALARRGRAVTLLEPQGLHGSASWGNAGHIAVEQVEPLASMASLRALPQRLFSRGGAVSLRPDQIRAWLPFALDMLVASRPAAFEKGRTALRDLLGQAMPAWQRLADDLGDTALVRDTGHYVVWESDDSAARGRARWLSADTGTATARDLTCAELDRITILTRIRPAGGLFFNGSGQIADPDRLAGRLTEGLERAGVRLVRDRVTALEPAGDDRLSVRLESGGVLNPQATVLSAGVGSKAILRTLGLRVPLIAERGYHIQSRGAAWPEGLAPVVFEDRSMIVTGFETMVRAASYVEFADPLAAADPRKWDRLEAHARALDLPIASGNERWMGARPTLPDYLPAIGRSARHPALLYAFGHQHLGLTLGPLTGEIIADLATGERPETDLDALAIERFRGAR